MSEPPGWIYETAAPTPDYPLLLASNPPPPKKTFNLLPKIINGGIAGIVGISVIFPLDLVKTRLQNQQIGPNGERMYNSIFDCFRKTIKSEGYFGMYRGSLINIILVTPEKAIKLTANDYFRYHLTTEDGQLPLLRQSVAGGLAGAFQIIVTTPMELLKIQMQDAGRLAMNNTVVEKTNAFKIAAKLVRERGIFGLYRGIGATALRDVVFSAGYFPMFATLNALGPRRENSNEAVFWVSFLSGLASAGTWAFLVTPFDVVKTRLQAITKAKGEREFNGILDCMVKTVKYEGPTALFKGGLVRMMVLAPVFAIVQTVYFLGVAEYLLGYERP